MKGQTQRDRERETELVVAVGGRENRGRVTAARRDFGSQEPAPALGDVTSLAGGRIGRTKSGEVDPLPCNFTAAPKTTANVVSTVRILIPGIPLLHAIYMLGPSWLLHVVVLLELVPCLVQRREHGCANHLLLGGRCLGKLQQKVSTMLSQGMVEEKKKKKHYIPCRDGPLQWPSCTQS